MRAGPTGDGFATGLLALLCAGACTSQDSADPPSPSGPTASTKTNASASAPPAVVPVGTAPPASSGGPCGGKAPGAHACDGPRLLRCGSQEPELVRSCFDIERCDAERGSCEPACPSGEVYVPATGDEGFVMGRALSPFGFGSRASGTTGSGQSDTPHRVVLTKPFCMDATEVTVAMMAACVRDLGCPAPSIMDWWATWPKKPDHPVNMANWKKAKAFCDKTGKSLPSEAQWEWAATGNDRRKWPWGDELPTCKRADYTATNLESPGGDSGCHGGGPSPVGSHPDGDRIWPAGRISDLAGNVFEWCLDNYEPYGTGREVDPVHLRTEGGNHVVRGGAWNRSHKGIMTAFRGAAIVTYQVPGLGFRCVRNAK